MNRKSTILLILFSLLTLSYCYSKDEIEIFQFQLELTKKYGSKINIYKFLKLDTLESDDSNFDFNKLTRKQIVKQIRKLSTKYHPDKNKKYQKLYERINIAKEILLNSESKKTYDYYLKSTRGFPKYNYKKGGFYHSLEGKTQLNGVLLIVFICLVIFPILHFIYLKSDVMGRKMKLSQFVESILEQHDDTNGLGVKNLKFDTSKEQDGSQVDELRIKFGQVYSVETSGKEILMNPDDLIEEVNWKQVFPMNLIFKNKESSNKKLQ
ncbi:hypothetical protein QEN19_001105 [Hanseniaspora menglaensis]